MAKFQRIAPSPRSALLCICERYHLRFSRRFLFSFAPNNRSLIKSTFPPRRQTERSTGRLASERNDAWKQLVKRGIARKMLAYLRGNRSRTKYCAKNNRNDVIK